MHMFTDADKYIAFKDSFFCTHNTDHGYFRSAITFIGGCVYVHMCICVCESICLIL